LYWNKTMKTYMYLGLAALLSLTIGMSASFAQTMADPMVIYTGGKGGGYDAAAKNLVARMEQRGVTAVVENRAGSNDITLQACKNPNSGWIAQIDALYVREMTDGCSLIVLGDYGTEMAAIFFSEKSGLDDMDDLTANHTIFVDKLGSGSELFWKTAVSIEVEHGGSDEWIEANVITGDLRRATPMANRGKIHAIVLVRSLAKSGDFTKLLKQGWVLGQLWDKDINDLQYGTTSLYDPEKFELIVDGKRHRNWGYSVKSFIGTTEAVEMDNYDVFDAMLSALE